MSDRVGSPTPNHFKLQVFELHEASLENENWKRWQPHHQLGHRAPVESKVLPWETELKLLSLLDVPSNHTSGIWSKCWQMLHYRTTRLPYLSNGLIWTSEDRLGLMQECLYEQSYLSETEENFLKGADQSLDWSTQTVWPFPQTSITLIWLNCLSPGSDLNSWVSNTEASCWAQTQRSEKRHGY